MAGSTTRHCVGWRATLGFISITFVLNLHAAEPVPPSRIKTPDGRTFRLYDNVLMSQPALGGLRQRGFLNVYTYDRPFPDTNTATFDVGAPRLTALQDGSADEIDMRNQMVQICARMLDPAESSVVILDSEWGIDKDTGIDYSVFYQGSDRLWRINAAMLANTAKILQWMKRGFEDSACHGHVRLGWYNSVDTYWNSFYDPSITAEIKLSHANGVAAIVSALAPAMDVLSPSLYAPWTPDDIPYIGTSNDALWGTAVGDTLTRAKALGAQYGLAVIPFLGLRYYHTEPDTETLAETTHYLNKYVDAGFFGTMIRKVSDAAYGFEGAIYWDWGPYGGPLNRNDGTDVFSKSAPWYQATFDYFSAPADNTAAVKNLIDEMIGQN